MMHEKNHLVYLYALEEFVTPKYSIGDALFLQFMF